MWNSFVHMKFSTQRAFSRTVSTNTGLILKLDLLGFDTRSPRLPSIPQRRVQHESRGGRVQSIGRKNRA
jgi:hypothetical protein